jgi:hypothetical protein
VLSQTSFVSSGAAPKFSRIGSADCSVGISGLTVTAGWHAVMIRINGNRKSQDLILIISLALMFVIFALIAIRALDGDMLSLVWDFSLYGKYQVFRFQFLVDRGGHLHRVSENYPNFINNIIIVGGEVKGLMRF